MTQDQHLTDRERQIVELVALGARNREVAAKLSISEQTVKNHLRNIFIKLGVKSRYGLIVRKGKA
jgi:DNA-binding CsgD family transcriptional regulator